MRTSPQARVGKKKVSHGRKLLDAKYSRDGEQLIRAESGKKMPELCPDGPE